MNDEEVTFGVTIASKVVDGVFPVTLLTARVVFVSPGLANVYAVVFTIVK